MLRKPRTRFRPRSQAASGCRVPSWHGAAHPPTPHPGPADPPQEAGGAHPTPQSDTPPLLSSQLLCPPPLTFPGAPPEARDPFPCAPRAQPCAPSLQLRGQPHGSPRLPGDRRARQERCQVPVPCPPARPGHSSRSAGLPLQEGGRPRLARRMRHHIGRPGFSDGACSEFRREAHPAAEAEPGDGNLRAFARTPERDVL